MRPIDADALREGWLNWGANEPVYDTNAFLDSIDEEPTLDVAPVVHGRWYVCEYEYLNCSVCGDAMYTGCNSTKEAKLLKDHWKNYCPNCGARMDGDTDV